MNCIATPRGGKWRCCNVHGIEVYRSVTLGPGCEQAQTNDDATLARNCEEILITDDAVVNSEEVEIVDESIHNSDEIQLVEEPKETELNLFRVVRNIIVKKPDTQLRQSRVGTEESIKKYLRSKAV